MKINIFQKKYFRLFFLLLLLLAMVSLAVAQDDIDNPYQGFSIMTYIISTIYWSSGYLLLYGAVLISVLVLMKLFPGFESALYIWLAALWVGGLFINFLSYSITHNKFLAGILGGAMIFGWSMLLNRFTFADIPWPEAKRLALILALICAPWFGPTQRTQVMPKPAAVMEEATRGRGEGEIFGRWEEGMKGGGEFLGFISSSEICFRSAYSPFDEVYCSCSLPVITPLILKSDLA